MMTIRELIHELNRIPKKYLDYGILLETDMESGDNQWLDSIYLHAKGSSGYELDGALELISDCKRWMKRWD